MLCTDAWLLFFLLKITVTIHDKIILYDFCKISSFSLTESEHQYAHFVQIMLSLQGSHSLFHTLGTSSLLSLSALFMPSAKQRDCIFSDHCQKLSWHSILNPSTI